MNALPIVRAGCFDGEGLTYPTGAGEFYPNKTQAVYLCIGTEKLTYDCVGPLVGTMLVNAGIDAFVYGTLRSPINALLVMEAFRFIRGLHPRAEIVVIDSAVGKAEDVGRIKTFNRGLRPALGTGKMMPVVGDKSIMGIVGTKKQILSSSCKIKPHNVYTLSRSIADLIINGNPFRS